MKKEFNFKGIESIQHGRRVLTGVINVRDLAELYDRENVKVDMYSAKNIDGYQRELSKSRARKFGRYVENGLSPSSILLYSRSENNGIEKISEGNYKIRASNGEPVLYLVDGQHRVHGFSEAIKEGWLSEDDEYQVSMSILFWDKERSPGTADPRFEEALHFYTLNMTQKKMRSDLAHKYIYRKREKEQGAITDSTSLPRDLKKKDYIPFEIYVTEQLRTDKDSPWKGLILPPNSKGNAPITEGAFTDSLGPIIHTAHYFKMNMGEVTTLLKNFWKAVFSLCPNAKEEFDEYALMKTSGVNALHIFLTALFGIKRDLRWDTKPEELKNMLGRMECFKNEEYWKLKIKHGEAEIPGDAASFGGGKKSFQMLANDILDNLED